ncbi:MAG: MBL fold metallo-hydrolase [Candidatus Saccharimonadales bacterium]
MTEQTNKRPASKGQNNKQPNNKINLNAPAVSRGAAIRAQRRAHDDANRVIKQYLPANVEIAEQQTRRANVITDDFDKLKITYLGGQEEIGEKNMQIIEWKNSAIVIDCGNWLGIELPGINYSINDTTYLEKIKHKIKGYIISHGHLDHLGGLKHIVPKFPAPIYGSSFTIGVIQKTFEEIPAEEDQSFVPRTIVMNMDNHERLKIGEFFIELVRVTHSVPESRLYCSRYTCWQNHQ